MEEMISTSKDIAEDAKKVTSYAEVIKDHCTDKRYQSLFCHDIRLLTQDQDQLAELCEYNTQSKQSITNSCSCQILNT